MENDMHGAQTGNASGRLDRATARSARGGRTGAGEPTIRDLARALAAGRWIVAGCLAGALLAAGAYLALARPTYRSVALVELDDDANGVARLESPRVPPAERDSHDGDIERLRARRVIGPVVDRLALDVEARPRRVPLLGDAMARWRGPAATRWAPPGLSRFGWGGERIAVSRLEVPPALVGEPLTLVALEGDRYRVLDRAGIELAAGDVGKTATGTGAGLTILVTELAADPGSEFRVGRLRRDDVIDAILQDLTVTEKGRKSGILEVALAGADPARVSAIVDGIVTEHVRQNGALRAGELARALELVAAQLPPLRARLEAAEAALSGFKLNAGLVDLAVESKAALDRVTELQKNLADTEAAREALKDHYTDRYPEMVSLAAKAAAIRGALEAFQTRLKELPGTELRATRLTREVTVAAEQYVATLNQIRALRVLQAGELAQVSVMDVPVVARKPVSPRPVPVLALAFLLGAGIGISAALVRGVLATDDDDDVQEIEDATGLPIFATLPHSDTEVRLDRHARGGVREPLAGVAPDDVATEHLRALRTALAFLMKARGNVVSVTSPTPRAGKTFVVSNLGTLLAAAGKRVLVVDADLRRGTLHRNFGLAGEKGLSELLAGAATPEQVIRPTGTPGLDVVARGAPAAHPAELLASPRLDEVLAILSKRYDVVLLDTAPTLAVTDPVLTGRCANLNLLVLRSRQHPVHEIELALERFARSGVQIHGAIVNDARAASRYAAAYEPYVADAAPASASADGGTSQTAAK